MKNGDLLLLGQDPIGHVAVNFYSCVSLINPIKIEVL